MDTSRPVSRQLGSGLRLIWLLLLCTAGQFMNEVHGEETLIRANWMYGAGHVQDAIRLLEFTVSRNVSFGTASEDEKRRRLRLMQMCIDVFAVECRRKNTPSVWSGEVFWTSLDKISGRPRQKSQPKKRAGWTTRWGACSLSPAARTFGRRVLST